MEEREGKNIETQLESDRPVKVINNAVTEFAGKIAVFVLEERLREGGSIEIPSLGFKIVRSNPEDPNTTHTEPL